MRGKRAFCSTLGPKTCFAIKSFVGDSRRKYSRRTKGANEKRECFTAPFNILNATINLPPSERRGTDRPSIHDITSLTRCPRIADGRCNRDIRRLHLIIPRRKRWRKKISAQPRNIRPEGGALAVKIKQQHTPTQLHAAKRFTGDCDEWRNILVSPGRNFSRRYVRAKFDAISRGGERKRPREKPITVRRAWRDNDRKRSGCSATKRTCSRVLHVWEPLSSPARQHHSRAVQCSAKRGPG